MMVMILLSYRGSSVCRWKVESGGLKGISARDYAEFYVKGRAEATIKNYEGAFRVVWKHAQEIGRSVFDWKEGEGA